MTDIYFTLTEKEPNKWEYIYESSQGHAMHGATPGLRESVFFRTMHMFMISLGPQNTNVVFQDYDSDLKKTFELFVHNNQQFNREKSEMYCVEFNKKFVNTLFNV